MKPYYITTAIDYANANLHLGHAYEKIGADVLARFKRLQGHDVHFLIGNDEHSTNVQKVALEKGLDPKAYCDERVQKNRKLWRAFNISFDDFIQTTEDRHHDGAIKLFQAIYDRGDIYKGSYQGWYCESCEAFYQKADLQDEKCPNHGTKPQWIEEDNYFFRLSAYQDQLLKLYQDNPALLEPEIRRNEILSFLKAGLEDVSISRPGKGWGIPLPIDESQCLYVWFDALINYMSAIGYGRDDVMFNKYWPADLHVIGKDITRFHCIMWPAMLMAAELPLYKQVFGHGFLMLKGKKMSKSLGHVVEPAELIERFGPDPIRYYILREGSFGRDGEFTLENFVGRYHNDLGNDLGNLLNRFLSMLHKYQDGVRLNVDSFADDAQSKAIEEACLQASTKVLDCLFVAQDISFNVGLEHIWKLLAMLNKYIADKAPWAMHKEGRVQELQQVLFQVHEGLRFVSLLLYPFMPYTAEKIWLYIGLEPVTPLAVQNLTALESWGMVQHDLPVLQGQVLFPRIEPGDLADWESR